MLKVAALRMLVYGVQDVVGGVAGLIGSGTLEWWANLWRMLSSGVLVLVSAFVRVSRAPPRRTRFGH